MEKLIIVWLDSNQVSMYPTWKERKKQKFVLAVSREDHKLRQSISRNCSRAKIKEKSNNAVGPRFGIKVKNRSTWQDIANSGEQVPKSSKKSKLTS
jgi:hypothetical protein